MSNVSENGDTSLVLEGMYKGVAGKIEEVKTSVTSVSRELKYGSTQQVAAYEALTSALKESVETILSEFRYLSQQSSVIHDVEEQGRSESQAVLLEAVQTRSEMTEKRVGEQISRVGEQITRVVEQVARIGDKIARVEDTFSNRISELEDALIALTDAILGMRPYEGRPNVEEPVERPVEKPVVHEEEPAKQEAQEPVAVQAPEESVQEQPTPEEVASEPIAPAYETAYAPIYAHFDEAQINYDLLAQKIVDALAADERFDINVFAEKLSTAIVDPDYEPLVDRIVASIPIPDVDAIADKIVAAMPAFDDQILAEKVADSIPPVDYDLIAERVTGVLEHEFDVTVSEEGVEKIAKAVSENLHIDDAKVVLDESEADKIAKAVSENLQIDDAKIVLDEGETDKIAKAVSESLQIDDAKIVLDDSETDVIAKGVAEKIDYHEISERVAQLLGEKRYVVAAPVVQPVMQPVVQPVVPAQPKEELAATAAVAKKKTKTDSVVLVPAQEEDPEMFTRLKKSFEAKIIESENDVKENYGALKNAFRTFTKVRSQMSWSNERFTFSRDTLAKIAIRGKTLCLYLALDPDEFPETVYHQKYAGDTKMYEKTPMMLKVKTPVAVKRAVRLIELLMERHGAVQSEVEPIDYVKHYARRSEEELLKAGLIKAAVVEKSDLDF